jgi:tetratricopeptide (TPR) repeat protein
MLIVLAQWLGDTSFEEYLNKCTEVGEEQIDLFCERLLLITGQEAQGRTGIGFVKGEQEPAVKPKLFLDNLETLLDKQTRRFVFPGMSLFFKKLITSAHGCHVVITSRLMPVLDDGTELEHLQGVACIHLKGLSDKDGAALLRAEGAEKVEKQQLEEISHQVDGNPLLLRQILPLVNRPSAGGAVKDLKIWKDKYKGEILKAVLFEEASEAGLELIFRLSLVPDRLGMENLERLCAEGKNAGSLVDDLVWRSLLESDREKGLFWLHPAVAETARDELSRSPEKLKAARMSALKMYRAEAPDIKTRDQWKSLDECFALVRATEQIIALGDFKAASELVANVITEPLLRWGHWTLLRELYEKLLALWESLPEKPKELLQYYGAALGNYGTTLYSLGDYFKAIEFHEKELKIAKEIGDRRGEGAAYCSLGLSYFCLRDNYKAIEFHKKALKFDIEMENKKGLVGDYGNLGNAYQALGDYPKAIEFQKKSIKIALKIGDRLGECTTYGNLGTLYMDLGDYSKAISYYEKRIEIAEEIGDARRFTSGNYNLGDTYRKLGEWPKAAFYSVRSMIVAVRIRMPEIQKMFQLTKECKAKLGDESFNRIATESLGAQGAEVVEKILADFEKALEAAKKAAKQDKPPDESAPEEDQKKNGPPDPRFLL